MDDTRQRLLNVAGEMFARKGFEGTTIRDICSRADANIAGVHYHFGDKEQLYIEAVRVAACESGDPPRFEWTDSVPPEQRLREFVHHMLTTMLAEDRPDWHIELIMREMAHPSRACEELVRTYIAAMYAQLFMVVACFLPADTPSRQLHLQAFAIVSQCLLYRYHRPVGRLLVGEEEFRRILDVSLLTEQIVTFSIGGLRAAARQLQEPLP